MSRFGFIKFALAMFCLIRTAFAGSNHQWQYREAEVEDLFEEQSVRLIDIRLPESSYDELARTHWGRGKKRPKALGTVKDGGATYTNVLIHVKGSAGSFQEIEQNPSLTLNFSKNAPDQRFHGLHRISLNNSAQDGSCLSEIVCRELFAAVGVPSPHVTFARVKLNGRDLGLHLLLQDYDKQFVEENFRSAQGNLYECGFCQEITEPLAVNSGRDPKDRSDLDRLAEAALEPDLNLRWKALQRSLDIDQFLSYLAMDVALCDWDGYAMHRNNYRIFHDASTGRLVFLPHGLDQMFGTGRENPSSSILPAMDGLVARAFLETPEGRRLYLQRLKWISDSVLNVDRVLGRVDALALRLRPAVVESGEREVARFDREVAALKLRIAERCSSVRRQLILAGVVTPVPN
jgi:spore coat protein H